MHLFVQKYCFLTGASQILIINIDDFCRSNKITQKSKFTNFLNTLSCTFGEQFQNFNDPLDENIISFKPFIQLDKYNYFCPMVTSLIPKLDLILENLLIDEKKNQTDAWHTYEKAKSKFLEDKTCEFFSRIFPQKCVHRNLFYQMNGKRYETDLLIIF